MRHGTQYVIQYLLCTLSRLKVEAIGWTSVTFGEQLEMNNRAEM